MIYELLLASGRVVAWTGDTPRDAARRYVDIHRTETVVAWRHVQHGLFVGLRHVVERERSGR